MGNISQDPRYFHPHTAVTQPIEMPWSSGMNPALCMLDYAWAQLFKTYKNVLQLILVVENDLFKVGAQEAFGRKSYGNPHVFL